MNSYTKPCFKHHLWKSSLRKDKESKTTHIISRGEIPTRSKIPREQYVCFYEMQKIIISCGETLPFLPHGYDKKEARKYKYIWNTHCFNLYSVDILEFEWMFNNMGTSKKRLSIGMVMIIRTQKYIMIINSDWLLIVLKWALRQSLF